MCQVIKCNSWSIRLCSHPTIIKKMKTYLELEGKLGPKPQPQSNQPRPAQPNTNLHVRKETKETEKSKILIPTMKYKVIVMARPNSSNTTMPPPLTLPNAPTNSEGQKPSQEGTSESNPHHLETSKFALVPHGLKQGRCQGTSMSGGKIGQSLQLIILLLLLFQNHK